MNYRFSDQVITFILEQSMVYTCACPAQVCKVINEQRALYLYQTKCLNLTGTDEIVHQTIANTVKQTHAQLEQCLEDILRLEGWNMETYQMPQAMREKLMRDFETSLK